jgi:hypothetical protein
MTDTKTNSKRQALALIGTLALALLLPLPGLAQCIDGVENAAIERATPSEDFLDRPDGAVLHRPTRLIWQRCALGQSWTGTTCSGTADELDWSGALQAARDHVQADADDWRIPNRNELASIVESRCHSPAINGEVFPATPSNWFWTGSPDSANADQAWVVLFADGEVQPAAISGEYAVRLVRGGRF